MNDTPTPETDKQRFTVQKHGCEVQVVPYAFARKLERERDAALHDIGYYKNKIDELNREIGMAKHTDLGYAAIVEQRDAAREDARRLAESVRECRGECDRMTQEGIRSRADKALAAHAALSTNKPTTKDHQTA